ncbi:SDR family NAD(P)-dependent oxidoreductase [Chloroflexota bacterium]
MGRLQGKVALITGIGSGIGRSAAIIFAKEGARVVGVDQNSESGQETLKLVKYAGCDTIFVEGDISKSEEVKKMIKTTIANYGKLDVLYNNAAITHDPETVPIAECKEEDFDRLMAVNLKGVFLTMKYAIPEMLIAGGGSIINTSSISTLEGWPVLPAYSASKGGVLAISKSVAMAYVSKNIRVNCIQPGPTLTEQLDIFMKSNKKYKEKFLGRCPSGRFNKPEEIAMASLFLATDEASGITGTEIIVDLGFTCAGFPIC